MDDFSQELVKDFLEEAFDLLDSLEKTLLILEKNSNDDKAINEVFRAVHTIKGGAGTIGFNEIQDLTHILEDDLDLARKKQLSFDKEDISLLLRCRDELERMINARAKDSIYSSPDHTELKERLVKIKERSLPAKPKQSPVKAVPQVPETKTVKVEPPVQAVSRTDDFSPRTIINKGALTQSDLSGISEALSANHKVYLIYYQLNQQYAMKDVSAFQIYALLNDVSELLKINPNIQDLETAFYEEVTFLISSDKDETFITEKTDLTEMINEMRLVPIDMNKLKELETAMLQPTTDNSAVKKEEIKPEEAPTEVLVEPRHVDDKAPVPVLPVEPVVAAPVVKPVIKEELDEHKDGEALQKRNVSTLRVESWKIDELLNLLGELVITKATLTQLNTDFDRVSGSVKSTLKDFLNGISKLNLSGDSEAVSEKNSVLLKALNDLFNSMDVYTESIQKLNRISSSLQENVMNMRMVPIQMVFSRFPRLIRDMSDKLNKKTDLIVEGVETEIDKGMVDDIFDPLIHILRNAVDHGIETPEERKLVGKPEMGNIILKAVHEGDSIVIEVSDDGKGINVEEIRKKAIEGGFMRKEALDKMTQKDILSLIFIPGFTTAKVVTDISGRGVGMDVVKKKIEEIGGNVGIATVPGKGTKIVIRLPLTLAIIQGLLIVVNDMHYVIPVASVEETVIINLKDLKDINGKMNLELRGKFVPIMSLKEYFYNEPLRVGEDIKEYCIIAKYGDSYVGILVSEVIGEQDIVIKSLNTKLIKSPGISAATIIGNGEIGFIMDTSQIIGKFFKWKDSD